MTVARSQVADQLADDLLEAAAAADMHSQRALSIEKSFKTAQEDFRREKESMVGRVKEFETVIGKLKGEMGEAAQALRDAELRQKQCKCPCVGVKMCLCEYVRASERESW